MGFPSVRNYMNIFGISSVQLLTIYDLYMWLYAQVSEEYVAVMLLCKGFQHLAMYLAICITNRDVKHP